MEPRHEDAAGHVSAGDLFRAFLRMGLSGFGGVLPWAHRVLVEDRAWLTDEAFAELLSLAQALPGPNIVNLAVFVGTRFAGARGAVAAFSGLMLAPLVIAIALAEGLSHYGHAEVVRGAVAGIASAAAGLVGAVAWKMLLAERREPIAVLASLLVFGAIGVLRWPLIPVLLVAAPLTALLSGRSAGGSKDAS